MDWIVALFLALVAFVVWMNVYARGRVPGDVSGWQGPYDDGGK